MGLNADPNQFVLLHNPACSKSKAALKLLEEGGILFRVREYLSEPLDEQELLELGGRLGLPLADWIRDPGLLQGGSDIPTDQSLAERMARQPELMQRPILVGATRAVIGRPPECLTEWLAERA